MVKFLSLLTGSALTMVALRTPGITAMIPTVSFPKTDTVLPNSIDDQIRASLNAINKLSNTATDQVVQVMLLIALLYFSTVLISGLISVTGNFVSIFGTVRGATNDIFNSLTFNIFVPKKVEFYETDKYRESMRLMFSPLGNKIEASLALLEQHLVANIAQVEILIAMQGRSLITASNKHDTAIEQLSEKMSLDVASMRESTNSSLSQISLQIGNNNYLSSLSDIRQQIRGLVSMQVDSRLIYEQTLVITNELQQVIGFLNVYAPSLDLIPENHIKLCGYIFVLMKSIAEVSKELQRDLRNSETSQFQDPAENSFQASSSELPSFSVSGPTGSVVKNISTGEGEDLIAEIRVKINDPVRSLADEYVRQMALDLESSISQNKSVITGVFTDRELIMNRLSQVIGNAELKAFDLNQAKAVADCREQAHIEIGLLLRSEDPTVLVLLRRIRELTSLVPIANVVEFEIPSHHNLIDLLPAIAQTGTPFSRLFKPVENQTFNVLGGDLGSINESRSGQVAFTIRIFEAAAAAAST
jgi:hypothetical protein